MKGHALLTYTHLSFSRDGARLLSINGDLDSKLTIWDVKSGKPLGKCEETIQSRCKFGSFCPLDANRVVTCASNTISFWKIAQGPTQEYLKKTLADPSDIARHLAKPNKARTDTDDEDVQHRFVAHCWDTENKVYVATDDGSIVRLDPDTGKVLSIRVLPKSDGKILFIDVVMDCLFVQTRLGKVYWLDESDGSVVEEYRLSLAQGDEWAHACLTPSRAKLVSGTLKGLICDFRAYVDEEVKHSSIDVSQIGQYHAGPVICCAAIAPLGGSRPDALLVTGGVEGRLFLWSVSKSKLVTTFDLFDGTSSLESNANVDGNKLKPKEKERGRDGGDENEHVNNTVVVVDNDGNGVGAEDDDDDYDDDEEAIQKDRTISKHTITALASCSSKPLVAAGTRTGTLHIVLVRKTANAIEPCVLASEKLSHRPIECVQFNRPCKLLAACSVTERNVYVLALDAATGSFELSAWIAVPENECVHAIAWLDAQTLVITTRSGRVFTTKIAEHGANPVQAVTPTELPRWSMAMHQVVRPPAIGTLEPDYCLACSFAYKSLFKCIPKDNETIETVLKNAHGKGVSALAISPQRHSSGSCIVATGSLDGSVHLWDWNTQTGSMTCTGRYWNHCGTVTTLCFVHLDHEAYVISTGIDGAVHTYALHFDGCEYDAKVYGASYDFETLNVRNRHTATLHDDDDDDAESKSSSSRRRSSSNSCSSSRSTTTANINTTTNTNIASIASSTPAELTYLERLKAFEDSKAQIVSERQKDLIRTPLEQIRSKLNNLIVHNASLPKDEQLERHEFVVFIKRKCEILKHNTQKCDALRNEIVREIAHNNAVADRIKTVFWDSAEQIGKDIVAFESTMKLYNFPIRRLSAKEATRLQHIRLLRAVELQQVRSTNTFSVASGGLDWLVSNNLLHPAVAQFYHDQEIVRCCAAAGGGAAAGPTASASTSPSSSMTLVDLLYHPFGLRTQKQVVNQMHLVQAYGRELKKTFNRTFDATMELKEAKLEEIRGKNVKIAEICRDLNMANEACEYTWSEGERPEVILTVHDCELNARPYETEAKRKEREEAEVKRSEEERRRQQGDAAGRALEDMMHGTLEVKKDVVVNEVLERESWMNELLVEEMSKEQKTEFEAFVEKERKLAEEKEKYRKILELELRKLKSEISEICRAFDEKLGEMQQLAIFVSYSLLAQEMFVLRLGQNRLKCEALEAARTQLDLQLEQCQTDWQNAADRTQRMVKELERCRTTYQELLDDEKQQDKSFVRDIEQVSAGGAALDHDTLRTLTELYKRRKVADDTKKPDRPRQQQQQQQPKQQQQQPQQQQQRSIRKGSAKKMVSLSGSAPAAGDDEFVFDPFRELEDRGGGETASPQQTQTQTQTQTRTHRPHETAVVGGAGAGAAVLPLDPDYDRPDYIGADDPIWLRLLDLRNRRLETEQQVHSRAKELDRMQDIYEDMQAQEEGLRGTLSRLKGQKDALLRDWTRRSQNTSFMIPLKQGQDETIVSRLSTLGGDDVMEDAYLVNRSLIESLNEKILKNGNEQVGILTKIKNFRKSINLMLWEHEFYDMKSKNLDEHYTDLQLLRVTKQLQEFFKGGDNTLKEKQELHRAESKLEHMKKQHQINAAKLKRTSTHQMHQLKAKLNENERFKAQLQELRAHVQIREDIIANRRASSSLTDGEGSQAKKASSKMKGITVRRKLVDLAKQQTEEIEYLRDELDKLRRRTFPSFVQPTRHDVRPPDEVES